MTNAKYGKILIAFAVPIGLVAWFAEEPIYRVALLLLFSVVFALGWITE